MSHHFDGLTTNKRVCENNSRWRAKGFAETAGLVLNSTTLIDRNFSFKRAANIIKKNIIARIIRRGKSKEIFGIVKKKLDYKIYRNSILVTFVLTSMLISPLNIK